MQMNTPDVYSPYDGSGNTLLGNVPISPFVCTLAGCPCDQHIVEAPAMDNDETPATFVCGHCGTECQTDTLSESDGYDGKPLCSDCYENYYVTLANGEVCPNDDAVYLEGDHAPRLRAHNQDGYY